MDFGLAQQYGGSCYLRFDDTNPEAEKQEFIDHIQDIVAWLGWTPWKACLLPDVRNSGCCAASPTHGAEPSRLVSLSCSEALQPAFQQARKQACQQVSSSLQLGSNK